MLGSGDEQRLPALRPLGLLVHVPLPLPRHADADEQYVPLLEGDAALAGDFLHVGEADLVLGKGGVVDALALGPGGVVDEDAAAWERYQTGERKGGGGDIRRGALVFLRPLFLLKRG